MHAEHSSTPPLLKMTCKICYHVNLVVRFGKWKAEDDLRIEINGNFPQSTGLLQSGGEEYVNSKMLVFQI